MSDRYSVEDKPIGVGGFSRVLLGKDNDLERPIAVKVLDPVMSKANDKDKEKFRREAKILAKLSHPNIPAIYDVEFEEPDTFRIIFQYIQGTTLRRLITDEQLSIGEVKPWFEQVASALGHAHENEIVHRDIKPDNLIITQDRKHCYLVDFGLALTQEEANRLTGSSHRGGTPGYMSPEQELGAKPEPSDDLFVLGVCLYEALSGRKVMVGAYEDLSIANEAIPPAVDDLILSCIGPKPEQLKTAAEFSQKLTLAFLPYEPLSKILAGGPLHQIVGAIRSMTAIDFMQLPPGQRRYIHTRGKSVVSDDSPQLNAARQEFLSVLPVLAVQVPANDYASIIRSALDFGFYREARGEYDWLGDRKVRDAVRQAASAVVPWWIPYSRGLKKLMPSRLAKKTGTTTLYGTW